MQVVIKVDGWDGGADVVVRISREGASLVSSLESPASDAGAAPVAADLGATPTSTSEATDAGGAPELG